MTAVREVFVACDGCDMHHGRDEGHHLVSEARTAAKSAGWVQRGRSDYCPGCTSEGKARGPYIEPTRRTK